jgi:hypothetical protein
MEALNPGLDLCPDVVVNVYEHGIRYLELPDKLVANMLHRDRVARVQNPERATMLLADGGDKM